MNNRVVKIVFMLSALLSLAGCIQGQGSNEGSDDGAYTSLIERSVTEGGGSGNKEDPEWHEIVDLFSSSEVIPYDIGDLHRRASNLARKTSTYEMPDNYILLSPNEKYKLYEAAYRALESVGFNDFHISNTRLESASKLIVEIISGKGSCAGFVESSEDQPIIRISCFFVHVEEEVKIK